MSKNKDLENFNAIERCDFSTGENSAMLKSISSMDDVLQKNNIEEVSINFAQHLLADVLKLKTAPTNDSIIKLLSLIFLPIITISMIAVYMSTGNTESPALITESLDKFYTLLKITSDPKIQQLLLIAEGIILLVIAEKIASSYKIYKYSSQA